MFLFGFFLLAFIIIDGTIQEIAKLCKTASLKTDDLHMSAPGKFQQISFYFETVVEFAQVLYEIRKGPIMNGTYNTVVCILKLCVIYIVVTLIMFKQLIL